MSNQTNTKQLTVCAMLSALGVVINDLHSVIARDIPAFIKEDRIHLTEAGVEAAAQHNAAFIRKYL